MANDDINMNMDTEDELSLEDLGGRYIKNPTVGAEILVTINRIVQTTKDTQVKNPKTGKLMKTSLSNVDYKIIVYTDTDQEWTCSSWEVWGKIKAIWKHLATEADNKDFKLKGQTFRIKHLRDGNITENRDGGDNYEVALEQKGSFFVLPKGENALKRVS
jgi:hypothetical protein